MALLNSSEMDKLSYEIFSILENKFLFGCYDDPKPFAAAAADDSLPETPVKGAPSSDGGKVRVLSIDGGIGATDGILAGVSLARFESILRSQSGDPNAKIADFFDVAAGSGTGGVLAAMLFTRGSDGKPLFSADEALHFLSKNRREIASSSSSAFKKKGIFSGMFRRSGGIFLRMFGESTLRDTVKPVLIPCFDLSTGAPFVFSRADAIETDDYNFKMSQVCGATCADRAVEMRSVDGRTKIVAVGGGVAMENPTSAAITHVLNNKQEFPFANGVEDLLVVSFGSCGDSDFVMGSETPSTAKLVKIAGSGLADTIDQAVAMAFGHNRTSNYVRIQANGFLSARNSTDSRISNKKKKKKKKKKNNGNLVSKVEMMMSHRNVESVLFRGKIISQQSNAEKLESFSEELIKEQNRRRSSSVPTVVIKQAMTPRSSSATISTVTTTTSTSTSTLTAATTTTTSSS